MFNKLKNFKELRDQAKQIQSQMAQEQAIGEAVQGKIKIIIDGNQQVKSVEIAPELLTQPAELQSGLKEAFNDAIKKIQKIIAMKMQSGNLNLPNF